MREDLDIHEIWERYYEGRNNGNGEVYKNKLIEHYRRLIKPVAKQMHKVFPSYLELDDMVSSGIFGLIDAIEDYDNTKKTKFESYAYGKIRWSILDGIREEDWVPQLIRYRVRQLKKTVNNLKEYLGRKPYDDELIEELSKRYGEDNAKRIIEDERSLLKKIHLSVDEIEGIENKRTPSQAIGLQREDLIDILMKGFTRAEKLIITLYYYEEMNMKEIGKTLGLNESRICQMHSSIMDRLKTKLNSEMYNLEMELESV